MKKTNDLQKRMPLFARHLFFLLVVVMTVSACASREAEITPATGALVKNTQTTAPALPVMPLVGKSFKLPVIAEPEITIGLLVDSLPHKFSCTAGFHIIRENKSLVLSTLNPGQYVTILPKSAGKISAKELFSVQAGSYKQEGDAEEPLKLIRNNLGASPKVVKNKYDHFFRIKFDPLEKELAQDLAEKLAKLGLTNIRIVHLSKDEMVQARFIRIFSDEGERLADIAEKVIFVPQSAGAYIEIDGKPYRGIIEIFINDDKKLTVINRLNIEDYLKGVVPGEMSGRVFPRLEALKAQAVAARTYALKNMGQFAKSGFDLCATPLCQVYKGVAAEQKLTNRAVDETAGLVATYDGNLINAMYTSTCGGHTEDVKNVFPAMDEPYLKGVSCYPEQANFGILLLTNKKQVYYADNRDRVNREVALLSSCGFLTPELPLNTNPVNSYGLKAWQERLHNFIYKAGTPPSMLRKRTLSRLDILQAVSSQLNWDKRLEFFINSKDILNLSQFVDYKSFPEDSLKLIQYLLREKLITPFHDTTLRMGETMNYLSLARVFCRILENYGIIIVRDAIFVNYEDGKLTLLEDGEETGYDLEKAPWLFYAIDGRDTSSERLLLRPGDKITYASDHLGVIKFIELKSIRKGLADGRFSSLYYWQQVYKREELEDKINRHVKIGKLRSIDILEYGISKRAAKVRITGSAGTATLSGLEIRRVLGIKENLFLIETRNNSAGDIAYYHFVGKGWGHGVGMCQFGAYGMALRGATFDRILKHYYTGIELSKITLR